MATPYNSVNQNLFNAMRTSNLFTSGVQRDIGGAMNSTFGALRSPTTAPVVPVTNVMQAGVPQASVVPPATALPPAAKNAALMTTPAVQTAGALAGAEAQTPVLAFHQRLMDAGINLNPQGQAAGDYARNVAAAQGVYNSVFGAGLPANATGGPVQAFAPTGLRDRALAANGAPVWGQGDVMAMSQGLNAQGGQRFALGQWQPAGGPNDATATTPQNPIFPIAPSAAPQGATPAQASPTSSPVQATSAQTPYQKNAQAFQDHIVNQQNQLGLLKGLPPGYMLDPNHNGAIMPIPGGPAYTEIQQEKDKKLLSAQQGIQSVAQTLKTIDSVLPKINSLTTGPAQALTGAVPGTPAYNLRELAKPIQSKVVIDQLMAIKEASKNGASGFGQLSDKEGEYLANSISNLNLAQDDKQAAKAYMDVRNHFLGLGAAFRMGLIDPATRTPEDIQNQNAVKWALNNPSDPRSEKILEANQ